MSPLAWAALAVAGLAGLVVDARLFAPHRAATMREGIAWSLGWVGFAVVAGLVLALTASGDDGVTYITVYAIERALSLDNLFVFLLIFGYFRIPVGDRGRLLFWGIIAALVLRGAAILGGVALLNRFSWISYVLGAVLLVLAYRVLRGLADDVDPEQGLAVRLARRVMPSATPFALCLVAIVAADLAFAVDSIPAAFGITRNSFLIWMGNVFALVGLRSLFVLLRGLVRSFRYLDQTIAAILALVAIKLLLSDAVEIGPLASLAGVVVVLALGAVASAIGDRRDPEGASARRG